MKAKAVMIIVAIVVVGTVAFQGVSSATNRCERNPEYCRDGR